MNAHERTELHALDLAEREGQLLTGAQRGRLADLRRAEIMSEITKGLLQKAGLPDDIEFRAPHKGKKS